MNNILSAVCSGTELFLTNPEAELVHNDSGFTTGYAGLSLSLSPLISWEDLVKVALWGHAPGEVFLNFIF